MDFCLTKSLWGEKKHKKNIKQTKWLGMILAWQWWWTPVEKQYKSSIDILSKLGVKTGKKKQKPSQTIYSALIRSSKGFWEESSSLLLWLVGREEWFQAPPPTLANHWHSASSWWSGPYVGCFSSPPPHKSTGTSIKKKRRKEVCMGGAGLAGWRWVGLAGGGWGLQCVHHIQKYPGVRSYLTFTTAQEPTKVQCTN